MQVVITWLNTSFAPSVLVITSTSIYPSPECRAYHNDSCFKYELVCMDGGVIDFEGPRILFISRYVDREVAPQIQRAEKCKFVFRHRPRQPQSGTTERKKHSVR